MSRQANAFCREVAASGEIFLIEHAHDGERTWPLAGGRAALPVWSSRSRVVRMLEGPLAGTELVIVTRSWSDFREKIVPDAMERDLLIGLNWSGSRARGYNLPPQDVVARVESPSVPLAHPIQNAESGSSSSVDQQTRCEIGPDEPQEDGRLAG